MGGALLELTSQLGTEAIHARVRVRVRVRGRVRIKVRVRVGVDQLDTEAIRG